MVSAPAHWMRRGPGPARRRPRPGRRGPGPDSLRAGPGRRGSGPDRRDGPWADLVHPAGDPRDGPGLDDVGVRMADSGTTVRQVPVRPAGAPAAGRPG